VSGILLAVVLGLGGVGVAYLYVQERARRFSVERLHAIVGAAAPNPIVVDDEPQPLVPAFPPRYPAVAPVIGAVTALTLWFALHLATEVAVAAGALVAVLVYLLEEYVAEQRVATIEAQLSDAIDLLVGSLRAGAALLAAFESALHESRAPLRPYLDEVVGRVRLGADPREVVADLAERIPLETFRLFALSLAVHWDVGGSVASTLATVGRTIRDRIELSRRVRAQAIEAHVSVAAVMAIAYILAVLMWRANPERLEAFVRTGVGSELVAAVIGLQAIGLVWMSRISRSGF
jgi:tight adherence protein B